MLIYLLMWFPMIMIAVINGLFREKVIRKFLSLNRAHQVSTVLLILLFGFYLYFVLNKFPNRSLTESILTGSMWCLLTLFFEFGMGLYQKKSWKEMLSNYNIARGKIWPLVPFFLLVAPLLYYVFTS